MDGNKKAVWKICGGSTDVGRLKLPLSWQTERHTLLFLFLHYLFPFFSLCQTGKAERTDCSLPPLVLSTSAALLPHVSHTYVRRRQTTDLVTTRLVLPSSLTHIQFKQPHHCSITFDVLSTRGSLCLTLQPEIGQNCCKNKITFCVLALDM